MFYTFTLDATQYFIRTMPGSAQVHLYRQASKKNIAVFEPDQRTLLSTHPSGYWVRTATGVNTALLNKLQPKVSTICRERLLSFKKIRTNKR